MIPKTIKSCELQLLTPCFCAGAHQTEPELRAPSFRGELRWWFRCLGGTRKQESEVFGSVHGECKASAVALLVLNEKRAPESRWCFEPTPKPNQVNSAYLTYFLSANEKNGAEDKVVRSEAWLAPGLKFTLEMRQLREISEENLELLNLAWECLCNLGAIGARKTRALGAYAPVNAADQKVEELLSHAAFKAHFDSKLHNRKDYGDFKNSAVTTRLLTDCAGLLKNYRKNLGIHPTVGKGQKEKPGSHYGTSVLGNAIGDRQCSAVRFRPVLVDGKLFICVLKAPDSTLGEKAKKHTIAHL